MINISFTIGEIEALIKFIDAGVRHNGLGSAEAAALLSAKIDRAVQLAQREKAIRYDRHVGDAQPNREVG